MFNNKRLLWVIIVLFLPTLSFANEEQSYALELDESVDGGQIISKMVFLASINFQSS